MGLKNMEVTGSKKRPFMNNTNPSSYAAKPSILVKKGGGEGGGMSCGSGRAGKALSRQSEGRDGR